MSEPADKRWKKERGDTHGDNLVLGVGSEARNLEFSLGELEELNRVVTRVEDRGLKRFHIFFLPRLDRNSDQLRFWVELDALIEASRVDEAQDADLLPNTDGARRAAEAFSVESNSVWALDAICCSFALDCGSRDRHRALCRSAA